MNHAVQVRPGDEGRFRYGQETKDCAVRRIVERRRDAPDESRVASLWHLSGPTGVPLAALAHSWHVAADQSLRPGAPAEIHRRRPAVWAYVAGGWHTRLAILEDRLHGRVPQPFFSARETLRIVRRFGVAPEAVFEALTVPEAMRVWWTEETAFDLDPRVGGRWTIERREGDQTFVAEGEYLEVEPPLRLRYTFGMPQFSLNWDTISVEIAPEGAGCVVVFEQSGLDIAGELPVLASGERSASEAGWQQGFDLMEAAWR